MGTQQKYYNMDYEKLEEFIKKGRNKGSRLVNNWTWAHHTCDDVIEVGFGRYSPSEAVPQVDSKGDPILDSSGYPRMDYRKGHFLKVYPLVTYHRDGSIIMGAWYPQPAYIERMRILPSPFAVGFIKVRGRNTPIVRKGGVFGIVEVRPGLNLKNWDAEMEDYLDRKDEEHAEKEKTTILNRKAGVERAKETRKMRQDLYAEARVERAQIAMLELVEREKVERLEQEEDLLWEQEELARSQRIEEHRRQMESLVEGFQ